MNKKAFTIIELMVTVCLISVVSFLLIELVLSLKTLYIKGDLKTVLLTKQGNMLKIINDDIDNKGLISLNPCSNDNLCLSFSYSDGEKRKLIVDKNDNSIRYFNYKIKFKKDEKYIIGDIETEKSSFTNDESITYDITTIKIPISNSLLNESFDIDILLQTEDGIVNLDLIDLD